MSSYDPRESRSALIEFLLARLAEDGHENVDGPGLRESSRYELKRMAHRYAGHQDFREEWRV